MLGNRLSWVDLLQDLQICRVLLVSCMWHAEGTAGGRSSPSHGPLQGVAQSCDIPHPATCFNSPQEETELLAGAWEDQESVTEPAGMAGSP